MNFQSKYLKWKQLLLLFALLIVLFSLWYTQKLAKQIANQEIVNAENLANAYKTINDMEASEQELQMAIEAIKENDKIPIIWINQEKELLGFKNIDSAKILDSTYTNKLLGNLFKKHQYIQIDIEDSEQQYLLYKDSKLLKQVKQYPFYQLLLVTLFFIISFTAFAASRRAEQNQVWVGLAKETAHQLGTPLSSLAAWIEILKDKLTHEDDAFMIDEMQKDIDRLELVAKRFSKIGSPPELQTINLIDIVQDTAAYMRLRAAHQIQIIVKDTTEGSAYIEANEQLMAWVFENLLKNSLDAMRNKGKIELLIYDKDNFWYVDISDTGKGIDKANFKKVFSPGFSTKKRGWGLGLTLTKRIIEEYHYGKIFVQSSVINKGTKFRIILKKKS
ncbi:MAG: HAMP domain-containing histidine kinase [Chitinophagales bacterium]|nr:HAMP domain-containing histidine kinase [Chitinophagales bacterium]